MTVFNGTFPPHSSGFVEKEDARFYAVELEDSTLRSDTSGGYELTRPQFTRKPRKTFKTGFTEASNADAQMLMEFWDEYQGFKSFTWVNPTDNQTYTVRMSEKPTLQYRGIGSNIRFDIEVTLKQV